MSKYSEFDALLLDCIKNGRDTFIRLEGYGPLATMAKSLAIPDYLGRALAFRVIDRRLQALRKAGKIAYMGGKWHIINV